MRRKAQALVEFALAVPLLMLVFCGVMEFGWLYYQLFYMNNAVRSAARVASEQQDPGSNTTLQNANRQAVIRVYTEMRGGAPPTTPTITIYPVTYPGNVATQGAALGNDNNRTGGNLITVTATATYTPLFGLVDLRNYGFPNQLRATYTFVIIGSI